jgi:hypothetical protein
MSTESQLAANRANAKHSTGPTTEAGKKRSSLNARRHGLTGQVSTMTDEDRAAHEKFSDAIVKDLAPAGAMETQLAQRIAIDSWRLNRMSAIEDNLFAIGIDTLDGQSNDMGQIDAAINSAHTFLRNSKQMQLLSLYEQRINRTLQKNLALLKSLQAERKAQRETQMKEAALLLQLSETRNIAYAPMKDGFVFSVAEIHAAIDLHQRRQKAMLANFTHFRPRKSLTQAA